MRADDEPGGFPYLPGRSSFLTAMMLMVSHLIENKLRGRDTAIKCIRPVVCSYIFLYEVAMRKFQTVCNWKDATVK